MYGQTTHMYKTLLEAYHIVLMRMRAGDLVLPKTMLMGLCAGLCWGAQAGAMDFIDINYSASVNADAAAKQAFIDAEAFWESKIIGFADPNDTHRLTINADISAIDGVGGVLGQAGPNAPYFNNAGFVYSTSGDMQFDSADVAAMVADGSFGNVIQHEMGHVLGIGTLWVDNGVYIDGSGKYTGKYALAGWRSEFGQPNATFVPVEQGGGGGTADGHWNEKDGGSGPTGFVSNVTGIDFEFELMTGWANTPTFLSTVTLGSLKDMGYLVVGASADVYTGPAGGKNTVIPNDLTSAVSILENGAGTNTLETADTGVLSLTMVADTTNAIVDLAGGTLTVGNGAGTITIADKAANLTIGSKVGDGVLTSGTTGASELTMAVNNTASTLTINSVIADNAGPGVLSIKIDGAATGTVVFNSANTYTGATHVASGILKAGADTTAFGVDSAVTVDAAGILNLNGHNQTIGSLEGNGLVTGGTATLTTGTNDSNTVFSGQLTDGAGALSVVKTGLGILTLTGTNTYSGSTTVTGGGALIVDGSINNSTTTVQMDSALGGNGSTGSVSVEDGGSLRAGIGGAATLTVKGNLTMQANSEFDIEFRSNGGTVGTDYSQVQVTGTVTLDPNTVLGLYDISGGAFDPSLGQAFIILDNTGANAVSGGFAGAANNGDTVSDGTHDFLIYYTAGDGNDVVLFCSNGTVNKLYVNDGWVNPANPVVDGDLQTAAVENALYDLNAFTTLTDAFTKYPGFSGTVTLNGGTYTDADLSTGAITLDLVADNANGELNVTIQNLTGGADDAIVTGFHNAPGLGNLVVYQGTFDGQILGAGDVIKDSVGKLTLGGATNIGGTFRINDGIVDLTASTASVRAGAFVQQAAGELVLDVANKSPAITVASASVGGTLTLNNIGTLAALGIVEQVLIDVTGKSSTGTFSNYAQGAVLGTSTIPDVIHVVSYTMGTGNDIGIATTLDPTSGQGQSIIGTVQDEMLVAQQSAILKLESIEDRLAAHRRYGFFEDRRDARQASADLDKATAVDNASLPADRDEFPASFYAAVVHNSFDQDGGMSGTGDRFAVGMDAWVNSDALLGVQFSSGTTRWDHATDGGKLTDLRMALFGEFALQHALFLDVGAGLGKLDEDTTRNPLSGTQKGSLTGWDAYGMARVAWRAIDRDDTASGVKSRLEPYAGVRATHTRLGDYTETGPLSLYVEGQSNNLTQVFAGATWSQWFDLDAGGSTAFGYHVRGEVYHGETDATTQAEVNVGTTTGAPLVVTAAANDGFGTRLTGGVDYRVDGWTFSGEGSIDQGDTANGWQARLMVSTWW